MVDTYGDSSSVILDGHGIILVDGNLYLCTVTCKSFVNGIVDYLIDKMMKTAACSGSDVHTGTFSYSLKSFKDLNLVSAVFLCYFGIFQTVSHFSSFRKEIYLRHLSYFAVLNIKHSVHDKSVINKVIYTRTCNECLDITY